MRKGSLIKVSNTKIFSLKVIEYLVSLEIRMGKIYMVEKDPSFGPCTCGKSHEFVKLVGISIPLRADWFELVKIGEIELSTMTIDDLLK